MSQLLRYLAVELSPPPSTAEFAQNELRKLGLSFVTIPEIPLGDGVLSITIPNEGWISESHFNSCMFPLLSTIFDGKLINSERHLWLAVEGGNVNNNLNPAFFLLAF